MDITNIDADYRNGCSCTNTPCRSKKLCRLNFYVSDRLASQETQFFRKNFELLQRCQQRKEKQGSGMSKKEVNRYLKKQQKEAQEPINNAFAEAFSKIKL